MAYLLVKTLHVLAVILWMGTTLFVSALLPRAALTQGQERQHWLEIIRGTFRRVGTPALVLTWVLGLALMVWGGLFTAGWLHAKLTLVLVLTGLHGMLSGQFKRLVNDPEHELPGWFGYLFPILLVLVAATVALVVMKSTGG